MGCRKETQMAWQKAKIAARSVGGQRKARSVDSKMVLCHGDERAELVGGPEAGGEVVSASRWTRSRSSLPKIASMYSDSSTEAFAAAPGTAVDHCSGEVPAAICIRLCGVRPIGSAAFCPCRPAWGLADPSGNFLPAGLHGRQSCSKTRGLPQGEAVVKPGAKPQGFARTRADRH